MSRRMLSVSKRNAIMFLCLAVFVIVLSLRVAGPAAARVDARKLTVGDAIAALRAVGATKTFAVTSPTGSQPNWGSTVLVTGGDILAQQVDVHVFPNASLIPAFLAQYPQPSEDAVQVVAGRKGWYVARKAVCNALVGSKLLLSKSLIVAVKAAQVRVVADLRRRCAGAVAAAGGRDSHAAHLSPAAADVGRARSLLLTKADLPGGFHIYRLNGGLTEFTGSCGKLADPDLSALTETAEVSGPGLANTDSGAEYLPSAYVFASPAQAARAQALETDSDYVRCGVALIKKQLVTIPHTVTGQTQHLIARAIDGVIVRGRQVILDVKVSPNYPVRVQVSFIFLRHGRALSELRMSSTWTAATRQTWNDAIDAAARRLKHSGF